MHAFHHHVHVLSLVVCAARRATPLPHDVQELYTVLTVQQAPHDRYLVLYAL